MCRGYNVRIVKLSNSCTDDTFEIINKYIARKQYKIAGEHKEYKFRKKNFGE